MTTCGNCGRSLHESELEWVRDKDHKPLKMVCVDCAELIYRRKEAEPLMGKRARAGKVQYHGPRKDKTANFYKATKKCRTCNTQVVVAETYEKQGFCNSCVDDMLGPPIDYVDDEECFWLS